MHQLRGNRVAGAHLDTLWATFLDYGVSLGCSCTLFKQILTILGHPLRGNRVAGAHLGSFGRPFEIWGVSGLLLDTF